MCRALLLLALVLLSVSSLPAAAEKRVALVIGNSGYKNVEKLTNPANDAAAMAEMFRKANFDSVISRNDLSALDMRRTLREFADTTRDADIAVVYYAGHGIEVDGTNYLLPIDAQLERDADVHDEGLGLDRILVAVEQAKQLRLVILDACRDNPFARNVKRTVASRSIGRGLAKVEPASPNTMVAFAAKAGSTAADGDGKNSPFATALVAHLAKPGLDIRKAFGFVRDDVLKATGNKQEPFVYGSLGGNDVALVPGAVAPARDVTADIRGDYELAERVGTREAWDSFIATYPDGFYAKLAQAQRNKLAAEQASVVATEKARLAEQERARLAADGARAMELSDAAGLAKTAEDERIAAERRKLAEDAKVAEARIAADKGSDDTKIAALAAPADAAAVRSVPADVSRALQNELKRVGCHAAAAGGEWNSAAEHALGLFNKSAGTKFDVKVASLDALEFVQGKTSRVCPLVCDRGFQVKGESCAKIVCRRGFEIGDDNTCERIQRKAVAKPAVQERKAAVRPPVANTKSSGQLFCPPSGSCRPLGRGCRIEFGRERGQDGLVQVEVCN